MISSNDDSNLLDRLVSLRTLFSIAARFVVFFFKFAKNTLRVRVTLRAGLLVGLVYLMVRRFRC